MNDFIELRRVIAIAFKRWWLIFLMTALAAAMGYTISRMQTPVYQATATMLIGQIFQSTSPDRADIQTSEALAQTYADIAHRQLVLQEVVETLGLNVTWQSLRKRVQVESITGTQLLQVRVEADSPEVARRIADEVANQLILLRSANGEGGETDSGQSFIHQQVLDLEERINSGKERVKVIDSDIADLQERIQSFQGTDNSALEEELAQLQNEKNTLEGLMTEWGKTYVELLAFIEPSRMSNSLSVVESAQASNRAIRPRVLLNTVLGGGLGMILALSLIFLLEYLDDTFKLFDDLYQSEELNILGVIGIIKGNNNSEKLITHLESFSPVIESYRKVRSKIRLSFIERSMKSIMVTSPMPGEGKSLTVANLGIALAQASIKTIIVDADLRNPVLHQVFNVENETGLADLLNSKETRFNKYLKNTSVTGLKLLTSGTLLQDPPERFGSERMQQILKGLEKIADVIIFDSPPALLVADAMVLSTQIDGVVLVIQSGKSKWSAVRRTLFDFQKSNANLLGSIINQVPKTTTFAVYEKYKYPRESAGLVDSLSSVISNGHKPARESAGVVDSLSSAIFKRRKPARETSDLVESPSSVIFNGHKPARETSDLVESPSPAVPERPEPAQELTDLVENPSSAVSKGRKPARETSDLVESPSPAVPERPEPAQELTDLVENPSSAVPERRKPAQESTDLVEDPSSAVPERREPVQESIDLVESPSSAVSKGRKPARESAGVVDSSSPAISKRRKPARGTSDLVESFSPAVPERPEPAQESIDLVESPSSAVSKGRKPAQESIDLVESPSSAVSKRRKPARETSDGVEGPSSAVSKRRKPARGTSDGVEGPSSAVSKRRKPARGTSDGVGGPSSAVSKRRKPVRESSGSVDSLLSAEKDLELASVENEEQEQAGSN